MRGDRTGRTAGRHDRSPVGYLHYGLALGAIVQAGEPGGDAPEGSPERVEVDRMVGELGWAVHAGAPARTTLAETLAALRGLGVPLDWRALLPYARLAERAAALDFDQLEGIDDSVGVRERALLLTVLLEPALLALRRLAQENGSARRHDGA
ncbi:hypothetical protein ACFZAR_18450 [Streptomyces sp. NPDC008222]|uniref:hypothetical protein n=1 Tax=Streptomyces sp. NPDC008222 TaxID=3364820 RepID=UPI0036F0431F